MALTKIDDRGLKLPLDLLDNEKIRLGTGNDLQIYHDSSDSIISDLGTGSLLIRTNGSAVEINKAASEYMARFICDGAVQLYHNNNKKFETTSSGALIGGLTSSSVSSYTNGKLNLGAEFTGSNRGVPKLAIYGDGTNELGFGVSSYQLDVCLFDNQRDFVIYSNSNEQFRFTGTGILKLNDGKQIQLGTSGDLGLIHDGTNSRIYGGTGSLRIDSNSLRLRSFTGTENIITGDLNGAVKLYYDSSTKFETTSTGVNIPDNAKLGLGSHPSAGGDLLIWHNGSDNFIDTRWNLTIRKDDGAETLAKFNNNAAVELYYDNVKKFETSANGITTQGGIQTTGHGTTASNNTFNSDFSTGARSVNIFASGTSANPYYSFVGTNLKLNGTDLVKPSDNANANWGNLAGIVFEGSNQNTNSGKNPAIRFLVDQPGNNGLNHSLGSLGGSGAPSSITSRTAAYFDSIGHFYHPDNKKAIYGTSEDLQIYHDGSNSRITDSGSGGLLINSSGFDVLNAADNEYMARFIQNAGVELYNDNVKKFATGANGVYHDNSGTLANNAIHFERGSGTGDFSTIFGVTNNPDCSGYGDQDDGYWNLLQSKGGTHIVLNSDGAYNSGRNNHDHFSIYQKANTEVSNAGRRLFSVDNIGQVQFGKAGIVINNAWGNQPSITVQRDNNHGEDNTDNSAYMRVHGIGDTHKYWTGAESAGADFSVNFIIDGSTYATSDGRAKTDIVDCPYGLDVVNKLQPRKYQLVNSQLTPQGDDNINLGFVAQEIKEHIPECVNYLGDEANTPNEKGWARAYALDIGEVIPVLTKAIQELSDKVKTLETKVAALEAT